MNFKKLFAEFRPSILFLIKFLGLYILFSAGYAVYLNQFQNEPDVMTRWVTNQTAWLLNLGADSWSQPNPGKPQVALYLNGSLSVSVYEGCNGLNMMLLFIAFIIAFGGSLKKTLWFIPLGLVAIHVANLLRIIALAVISITNPRFYYIFHKYFFTAIIFAAIFLLWYIWVVYLVKPKHEKASA